MNKFADFWQVPLYGQIQQQNVGFLCVNLVTDASYCTQASVSSLENYAVKYLKKQFYLLAIYNSRNVVTDYLQ